MTINNSSKNESLDLKGDALAAGQIIGATVPRDPIQETAGYRGKDPLAYDLSTQHYDTSRRLKVIVAGAGCSGLDFAHAVESGKLKNIDLQIYEKNAGLGGTWWENRYPGCACDIPSHNYLVSL